MDTRQPWWPCVVPGLVWHMCWQTSLAPWLHRGKLADKGYALLHCCCKLQLISTLINTMLPSQWLQHIWL